MLLFPSLPPFPSVPPIHTRTFRLSSTSLNMSAAGNRPAGANNNDSPSGAQTPGPNTGHHQTQLAASGPKHTGIGAAGQGQSSSMIGHSPSQHVLQPAGHGMTPSEIQTGDQEAVQPGQSFSARLAHLSGAGGLTHPIRRINFLTLVPLLIDSAYTLTKFAEQDPVDDPYGPVHLNSVPPAELADDGPLNPTPAVSETGATCNE
jgi:hypothetical protein